MSRSRGEPLGSKAEPAVLPKLNGGDFETGPFILGLRDTHSTDAEAARAVLREVPGLAAERGYSYYGSAGASPSLSYAPASYGYSGVGNAYVIEETGGSRASYSGSSYDGYPSSAYSGYNWNYQDWGRKWLTNGGCIYIDMNKVELAIPAVLSAYDHVAAFHALLRWEQEALARANAKLPKGQQIVILVNNSDGRGNSWGGHTNFLLTRRCWQNIFERKLQYLLHLATFFVSSLPVTGAGKVGSENGRPDVAYQLAQRADFYECLVGIQTTHNRPIVNSRDESHAAASGARLHNIFFDNTLCHGSTLLKIGTTQLVLAMIEQEELDRDLILDDPLPTVIQWSHDPTLRAKARLVTGADYTAVETQLAFLERAQAFVAAGRADGLVPRADEILALWADTLLKLQAGDLDALAGRLDWVLKLQLLQSAMADCPELAWDSPKVKYLDLLYASLDPEEGLFWASDRDGAVERAVSDADIERFVHQAPEDTRAWTRAEILKHADPATIEDVNWDSIRFRFREAGKSSYPRYSYHTLRMKDPLRWTRGECEPAFAGAASFEAALRSLGMKETDYAGLPLGRATAAPAERAPGSVLYLPEVAGRGRAECLGDEGDAGPRGRQAAGQEDAID